MAAAQEDNRTLSAKDTARLLTPADAGQRARGYELLDEVISQAAEAGKRELTELVKVATACVGPLLELQCAGASDIGLEEFQRVGLLIFRVCSLDMAAVGKQLVQRYFGVASTTLSSSSSTDQQEEDGLGIMSNNSSNKSSWKSPLYSPRNAVSSALSKPAAAFTRDDALTVAHACAADYVLGAAQKRDDLAMECTGFASWGDWQAKVAAGNDDAPSIIQRTDTETAIRCAALVAEMLGGSMDAFKASGAEREVRTLSWRSLVTWLLGTFGGYPSLSSAVAEALIMQHDLYGCFLTAMRSARPLQRFSKAYGEIDIVSHACLAFLLSFMSLGAHAQLIAQMCNADPAFKLQSMEVFEICLETLRACELSGPSDDVEPTVIFVAATLVNPGEGEELSPGYGQKVERLKGSASTIRYLLDHPVPMPGSPHWTSTIQAIGVAVAVFGKDEEGAMPFTQEHVDTFLAIDTEMLTPQTWGHGFPFSSWAGQNLRMFCLSDTNQRLLLNNPGLIPHLLAGLLMEPDAPRANAPDEVKAAVQTNFAEALQLVALFEPGRQALEAHQGAKETLQALSEKGWTPKAREFGRGAMMALAAPDVQNKWADSAQGAGLNTSLMHLMISYRKQSALMSQHSIMSEAYPRTLLYLFRGVEWDFQEVVKRIVSLLQGRGFNVWFDLECMKGSTIVRLLLASSLLWPVCPLFQRPYS